MKNSLTRKVSYLYICCRNILETYASEMKKLALAILGHMAKALNMNAEEMNELFNDGVQSMRMNFYPPCPEPEKAIGFTPHSDAVALTILFQLNETEGLQIRKEGKWVPVKPLPNAFIVNIGDIMEVLFSETGCKQVFIALLPELVLSCADC